MKDLLWTEKRKSYPVSDKIAVGALFLAANLLILNTKLRLSREHFWYEAPIGPS